VPLVACEKGFHGRSLGALSITHRADYREPFGPLLPEVAFVPFGDGAALEAALRATTPAAFIVEPIQAEGGIRVPPPGFLAHARDLCTRHGALFVADEIQTGLGRTGSLFAVEAEGVVPDVLLLGKSLGGGVVPISAVMTTERLFRAAGGDTSRTPFHSSTFGGDPRACAAAIAALQVTTGERLPARAAAAGDYLLGRLRELQSIHPLITDIRGRGLLIGIEFAHPARGLAAALRGGVLGPLADGYLCGVVMMRLLQDHQILTAVTINEPTVLRVEPPLVVEHEDLDCLVDSLERTLALLGSTTGALLRATPALLKAMFH
jgi:putrescine aminotransferase